MSNTRATKAVRQKRRRTELCSKMDREMANAWKGEMQPPRSMLKRFFWSLPTCRGSTGTASSSGRAQAELRGKFDKRLVKVGVAAWCGGARACSVGELSSATLASCTFLLDMQHARPSYESWNICP